MAAAGRLRHAEAAAYERPLCPSPADQAKGPDWLDHAVGSPLRTYEPPPGAPSGRTGRRWPTSTTRVLTQQPLRVAGRISSDAFKLFAVTRDTYPGDTPISRWQFHTSYPIYLPTIKLDKAGTIILDLKLGPADGASVYRKLDTVYGGNTRVWKPGAAFLRRYQLYGGFTPGPLLLLCLLAGLAGALTVFRRRASEAQRQLALGAVLFVAGAIAVLVMSDLFEFSWRYQLPALVTLPPAGAFGIAAILRYARRRNNDRVQASGRAQDRGRGQGRVTGRQIQPRRRNSQHRPATAATSVPMPRIRKAGRLPRRPTSQAKFWPKNPVRNDSGRNTVAMMVSCFITSLSRLDTIDR